MRKIFLLLFILAIPLVLASTVIVDKDTYTLNEPVTISMADCLGSSMLTILNPFGQAVFSDQGNDDWSTTYHTSSDPSSGTYTINLFCGDESSSTTFTVTEEIPSVEGDEDTSDNGDSSGPSGGHCVPEWSCGYWSICGPELIQTRTCYDQRCSQPPKIETKDCLPCDESWVCSLWSDCVTEDQTRMCYDEHHCGTMILKPITKKPCGAPDTGPAPARIVFAPPDQFTIPSPTDGISLSFWQKYKLWIILIPILILLLLIGLYIYFRFYRAKTAADTFALKNWVKKALAKGVSKEKVKEMVQKQTKWTGKELNKVFRELEQKK